jgi:hypothetical protein
LHKADNSEVCAQRNYGSAALREYSSFWNENLTAHACFSRERSFTLGHDRGPNVIRRRTYALSVKQPWAALLVAGRKTVEIRKWSTAIRGQVFIHAARIPDDRPEGWARVTEDLRPLAEMEGGLIGTAELAACIRYRSASGFAADAAKHLNDPSWFEPPQMYGFVFRSGVVIPFVPCKGNVRFFTVEAGNGK